MPVIRRKLTAATSNALAQLRFSNPKGPALVTLYAAGTAADAVDFGVDDQLFMESAPVNVQSAADVIDTSRDALLQREPVPGGQYVLNVPTVTTEVVYQLNIETA